jgi:hypothetical protein
MNGDASSDRELRQLAHEQARIEMTVERIEHGSGDVHANTRIDIRRAQAQESALAGRAAELGVHAASLSRDLRAYDTA